MVDRDGCEGWWEAILLCKIFKINSYFFPIFSGKFLFFPYFLGARIPIFLFFWPFLLLDALPSANELRQGNVFTPVCQSFCSRGGGGVSASVHAGIQHPQAGTPPRVGTVEVRLYLPCESLFSKVESGWYEFDVTFVQCVFYNPFVFFHLQ